MKIGEEKHLIQKAAFLLLLAEKEVPTNPLLVVQHLIDAISSEKAVGLDLEVKKGLAKALHRYVDLTVIFQSEKKILGRLKEAFYEKLEEVISLLSDKDLQENSIRFSLESALAGLNTLKDTSTKMQDYLVKIVQVGAAQDLGGAVQLLQEVWKEKKRAQASSWYVELLLIRLIEPLILQSEALFKELLDPLAEGNDWQLFYGVSKTLEKIVEKGPSFHVQREALDRLGELASFSKFNVKNNWRVREAALEELIHLSSHQDEQIRDQVNSLLLAREAEEQDPRVSAHFPQREKTLERKKNWDTHLKRTIDPSVDKLARERLIEAPIIRTNEFEGPFSLIQKDIAGGNFELAWHNLLNMKKGGRFEAAIKTDPLSLYHILEKLLPYLLESLSREGVKLYTPALKIYEEALHLAIKLKQNDPLQTLYKNSSKLLSAIIFEQLELFTQKALDNQDQPKLEALLKDLALAKEMFCHDKEDQNWLIKLHRMMLLFFENRPLLDKKSADLIHDGQRTDEGDFPEPYVQRCYQALGDWKSFFASEELFTAFPTLLGKGRRTGQKM